MKTVKKTISSGTKEYVKKDGTKVTVTWPAGEIEMESAEGQVDNPFIAGCVDSQLLHHDASTLWRSTSGFAKGVPTVKGAGKFWLGADGVLRVNWDYVPTERAGTDEKAEALVRMAKALAAAEGTDPATEVRKSFADKTTKERALALLGE